MTFHWCTHNIADAHFPGERSKRLRLLRGFEILHDLADTWKSNEQWSRTLRDAILQHNLSLPEAGRLCLAFWLETIFDDADLAQHDVDAVATSRFQCSKILWE